MFTVTESAASKIRKIIDEEDPNLKLRIFVQGGGCSGFKYGFSLEELPPADDDFAFEKDGIQVVIDSMSMQYMNDAEIDYEETLLGAEFKIKNPNAESSCGCGKSFAT